MHRESLIKLLTFFQGMYAHSLTLQDLMESEEELEYSDVKRKYDQQAAQQFALFFRAIDEPEEFAAVTEAFLSAHPKPGEKLH